MLKTDVNLFRALDASKPSVIKAAFKKIVMAIAVLAVLSINVVLYFYLDISNKNTNEMILQYTDYINSAENITKQEEYFVLQDEIKVLQDAMVSITELEKLIEVSPKFDIEFYNKVMSIKPERVNISDIIFTNNVFEIKCTTIDNSPPADYAQSLDMSELFDNITYQGFAIQQDEADQTLTFTIRCTLKEVVSNEN